MLVMLAYDVPETKHQTFLRTEFGRLGGIRVQYSLYLFEGYDHREIAEILGITEGGSKSQFNRAKSKLRDILIALSYV